MNPPVISRWNNPLILTMDPYFRPGTSSPIPSFFKPFKEHDFLLLSIFQEFLVAELHAFRSFQELRFVKLEI